MYLRLPLLLFPDLPNIIHNRFYSMRFSLFVDVLGLELILE